MRGDADADGEPLRLIDEALLLVPERDPSRPFLYQLRRQLVEREITFQDARRSLVELEASLEKVTAPAHRVGVYVGSPAEGIATILISGSEYHTNIDPRVAPETLRIGCRVLVNEAYAVVGSLGPSPSGPVAKVADLLEEGRVRVGGEHGAADYVLERSDHLLETDLKPGDEVRADPSMRVALEVLPSKESRGHFLEEVPVMSWDQIGGQQEAIQAIRDTIELPALHPELFERFQYSTPKGFLLHGPPGCGKTMIGKATAYNLVQHLRDREGIEVRECFMHIKGPEILNMWLGETERLVREIFSQARRKRQEGRLPFIFIDEAESILGTRRSMRSHYIANTVVPTFCTEMDGIESLQDVVIILASNRHDLIDPAILRPGRIDRKIKVLRPDLEASREILAIHLTEDLPLCPIEVAQHGGVIEARQALIDQTVQFLFQRTEENRFLEVYLRSGRQESLYYGDLSSGAVIANIVQRAKEKAIKRAVSEPDRETGIRLQDLTDATQAEYREDELFPPSDSVEDWLKLLDYDPENVARVSPVQSREEREAAGASGVI